MGTTLKRTTVRLPAALLDEAKALASRRHTTVTQLIETGLRMQLETPATVPPPLVLPVFPVGKRERGLADGVPPGAWNWSAGKLEGLMEELENRLPHEPS